MIAEPHTADDTVAVGRLLAHQRRQLGVSLEDATRQLLLSKSQIEGLERGEPGAFYNPQFYRQALRKYAAYLQVALPELPATTEVAAPVLAPALPAEHFEPPSRTHVYLAVAAGLIVVVGGAGWFIARAAGRAPATVATVVTAGATGRPVEIPADIPTDTPAAPPAPPVTTPGPSLDVPQAQEVAASAVGILTVDDPSWVFIRYADGSVVQRAVNPGEQLALTQRMVYLAAGTRTVHVTVADRMIDTRPFVTDKGEVRVSARQLETWPFPDLPTAVPPSASTP